jgi:membrane protein YdbS with pleckstrin-like domain
MHCTNCGSYIAPGAKFCAGCGQAAIDPEVTRVAGLPGGTLSPNAADSSVEQLIFKVRPTLLFIKTGYILAALGAVILVALLAYVDLSWVIAIPVGLALLLIPAFYHIRRNTISYTLTDSKIEIDRGLIGRTTRNIPLRNIQDVTVQASIAQRLLGYGNVIIDNASEFGGTTILRNIHDPRGHADLLLRQLRRWH